MTWLPILNFQRNAVLAIGLALLVTMTGINPISAQEPFRADLDLTDNGVIDDSDALVALQAIRVVQAHGVCMIPEVSRSDVNGDACVDISDVQIILAHWGEQIRLGQVAPLLGPLALATFTVNSANDRSDMVRGDGQCNTGHTIRVQGANYPECTLRAAIEEANNRSGAEIIAFNVLNSNGSCPQQVDISISNELLIDDPLDAGITIDGFTQCGASPNTQAVGGNAVFKVQIKGGRSKELGCLKILSGRNIIKGLALYESDSEIAILGIGAWENRIQGNVVGNNATFNWSGSPFGNALTVANGAHHNLIGGSQPHQRNMFNLSSEDGITVRNPGTKFNTIVGNYIGLKQDGKTKGNNRADGIDVGEGAKYNWIGASPPAGWLPPGWQEGNPLPAPDPNRSYNPGERNVISGNGKDGIEISHQTATQYNYVVNNYIGLDATGTQAVRNEQKGITFEDLVDHNFAYDNVIANNGNYGIRLKSLATYNEIVGNYIGVGIDGKTPMGNGTADPTLGDGILLVGGSKHTLIKNNIIANHPGGGIRLYNDPNVPNHSKTTYFNTMSRNSIFNNSGEGIIFHVYQNTLPNQGINSPQITGANPTNVAGTACASCKIEIFITDKAVLPDPDGDNDGEGKTFIGEGGADGNGNFFVSVSGVTVGQLVTSTATDNRGNTSKFSRNFVVSSAPIPPPPTATPPPPAPLTKRQWLPIILR